MAAAGLQPQVPLDPRAARILKTRRRARFILLAVGLVLLIAILAARAGASRMDHDRYHQQRFGVIEVLEGDTLRLAEADGTAFHAKLIGVDSNASPEARRLAGEACGREVLLYLETVPTRNHAGELLAYAYSAEGALVNGRLIESGWVFADRRWDYSYLRTFLQMEEQARLRKRGMWASPADPPMPEWRRRWLAEMAKEPWKRGEWRRADEP